MFSAAKLADLSNKVVILAIKYLDLSNGHDDLSNTHGGLSNNNYDSNNKEGGFTMVVPARMGTEASHIGNFIRKGGDIASLRDFSIKKGLVEGFAIKTAEISIKHLDITNE